MQKHCTHTDLKKGSEIWSKDHPLWKAFVSQRINDTTFLPGPLLPSACLSFDHITSQQQSQTKILSLYQWLEGRATQNNKVMPRDIDALIVLSGGQFSRNHAPDFTLCTSPSEPLERDKLLTHFFEWLDRANGDHLTLAAEIAYSLLMIQPHPFAHYVAEHATMLYLLQQGYLPPLLQEPLKGNKTKIKQVISTGLAKTLELSPFEVAKPIQVKASDTFSPLQAVPSTKKTLPRKLMKIGTLAKHVGETVPTIRYWTQAGLLNAREVTHSGYHLYDVSMIERCEQIQQAKIKRLTLSEIRSTYAKKT